MSAGDDDDCVFWCFEEKGGVGELWAGVAAAEVSCSALLCTPPCVRQHHSFFRPRRRHGNKYGSKFRRNTCKEKRAHLGLMRAGQVNAVAKSGRECNTSVLFKSNIFNSKTLRKNYT